MHDLESTAELVRAYQSGDQAAREKLVRRCLPLLQRWARGRLPPYGRSLAETDDLVQVSLLRALNNLNRFDSRRPGALLSYLRTILMNTVREEIRRSRSAASMQRIDGDLADPSLSVLDRVIGIEQIEAYERGLEALTERQREAVILRLEFDLSFSELAAEIGSSSADAARMLVARGLVALAEAMR
jgi:RNA polymerase sigma-70 factor (ECF subfamily)